MMPSLLDNIYKTSKTRPATCLDLFSGAGGLSIGFAMAGGKPMGAVDIDRDSIDTYAALFPDANDVECCEIESWKPKSRPGKIDVIIGGPPCQGFSLARGLRFLDDPRNHLYKYFVQVVNHFKPEWVVMENVEGIRNIGGGIILQQILDDFASIGYLLECKVVNMANYGVPQLRRRAIFVGNRKGIEFNWPTPFCNDARKTINQAELIDLKGKSHVSVNSALSDMILPQGNFFAHRANSQMRGPRNRNAHTEPAFTLRVRGDEFALCELPATSAFIPGPIPDGEIKYRATQNELQEILRGPSPSWIKYAQPVSCKKSKIQALQGTRRLTIKEQARLQTFPDWVSFKGRVTSQARQIGNAVPPLFSFQLFNRILEHL